MKDILVYQPTGDPAQVALFIEGLDPKLREKLLRQIIPLPRAPDSPPHSVLAPIIVGNCRFVNSRYCVTQGI